MAELTNCPGCGRNCPINNLHCRRGEQIVSGMNSQSSTEKQSFKSETAEVHEEVSPLNQKLMEVFINLGRYSEYLKETGNNSKANQMFENFDPHQKELLLDELSKLNYDISLTRNNKTSKLRRHHFHGSRLGHHGKHHRHH